MRHLAVALSLIASPAAAETCFLAYQDTVLINGPCHFDGDADGSFSVRDTRGFSRTTDGEFRLLDRRRAVFAMLSIDGPGEGIGFTNWFEGELRSSAHTPLGNLRRFGACWRNSQAIICAWE